MCRAEDLEGEGGKEFHFLAQLLYAGGNGSVFAILSRVPYQESAVAVYWALSCAKYTHTGRSIPLSKNRGAVLAMKLDGCGEGAREIRRHSDFSRGPIAYRGACVCPGTHC